MSYHLRDVKNKCSVPACTSYATKAIFNSYNACLGEFCTHHARWRLRDLEREAKKLEAQNEAERTGGET